MDFEKLTPEQKDMLANLLQSVNAQQHADEPAEPAAPAMTSDEARQVLNETLSILAANCPALSVEQRLRFETALGVEG